MRYIGSCFVDGKEYSTYFLTIVSSDHIKAIVSDFDIVGYLSDSAALVVGRETLKNYNELVARCIEQNNISYRTLITDFSKPAREGRAQKIKSGDNYAVNILIEKGSADETVLNLTAGVTAAF